MINPSAFIVLAAIHLLGLGISLARHGEKKKEAKYNVWSSLFYVSLMWFFLWWGGVVDMILNP